LVLNTFQDKKHDFAIKVSCYHAKNNNHVFNKLLRLIPEKFSFHSDTRCGK